MPAAAVLLVEGHLDGKEARVGLDSFAGAGMVTAKAVAARKDEWKQTDVRLQGVAQNPVKPHGGRVVASGRAREGRRRELHGEGDGVRAVAW